MGSDGLWEFMKSKDVAKILKIYENNLEKATYQLYKASSNLWKKEESVIDDICVILIDL